MFSTGIEMIVMALLFFPGTLCIGKEAAGVRIVIRPLWLELAEKAWAYRQNQLAQAVKPTTTEQLPASTA